MRHRLLILLLALGACAGGLEKATQKADKSGDKPLVIMATADWCGPCHYFKKHILPSPQVQAALKDVEFVMLDHADAKMSLRRLGVRAYPSFLVVRPDKRVVAELRGAVRADRFVDFLTWGTPRWFTDERIRSGLGGQPTTRMKVYAARYFALNGHLDRTSGLYEDALAGLSKADEWRRSGLSWEMTLVSSMGTNVAEAAKHAAAFADKFPASPELPAAARFVVLSGGLAPNDALAFGARAVHLLRDKPQALNGLTYDLLAARMPALAVASASRQVELVPDDANAHDSLAEAFNYLGNRGKALEHADIAIRKETASDLRSLYRKHRARFAAGTPSKAVAARYERFARLLVRYRISP